MKSKELPFNANPEAKEDRKGLLIAPIFNPRFWGRYPQDILVGLGAAVGFITGFVYSNYYLGATIGALAGLGTAIAIDKTCRLIRSKKE